MRILLTGGAGYIGSHTLLELLEAGHEAAVIDDLSNSSEEAVERVRALAGTDAPLRVGDIRDVDMIEEELRRFAPDAVIHFAGLKSVDESLSDPLRYYSVNVAGTVALTTAMNRAGRRKLLFSSSATVYGAPNKLPLDEGHATAPINPYGWSKLMSERILRDWSAATPGASAIALRYFNPVGAHESGRIGEDPEGPPANLFPFIAQVAVGRRPILRVFGDDYDTRDGTGERDYIHVVDLAQAHLSAVEAFDRLEGFDIFNIGTGRGYTVLEVVEAFERVSGQGVRREIVDRRPGDVAACFADPARATATLGWRATRDLDAICRDLWRWQSRNPMGYRGVDARR